MSKLKHLFFDLLIMPIDDACRAISELSGEKDNLKFKDIPWRPRWRFRIWTWGEWKHWWRWKGLYSDIHYRFIMWQHKHNLRCRCVTHFQDTGKHKPECPKSEKFRRPK